MLSWHQYEIHSLLELRFSFSSVSIPHWKSNFNPIQCNFNILICVVLASDASIGQSVVSSNCSVLRLMAHISNVCFTFCFHCSVLSELYTLPWKQQAHSLVSSTNMAKLTHSFSWEYSFTVSATLIDCLFLSPLALIEKNDGELRKVSACQRTRSTKCMIL